jgi:hypothetical protein
VFLGKGRPEISLTGPIVMVNSRACMALHS